jgi:hypothetical protein
MSSRNKVRTPVKTAADPRQSAPAAKAPAAPSAASPTTTPAADTHFTHAHPPEGKAPKREKVDLVSVTVPQAFNLTLDDHSRVRYEMGIQDMPREHAEHFYAKANGVEKNED